MAIMTIVMRLCLDAIVFSMTEVKTTTLSTLNTRNMRADLALHSPRNKSWAVSDRVKVKTFLGGVFNKISKNTDLSSNGIFYAD